MWNPLSCPTILFAGPLCWHLSRGSNGKQTAHSKEGNRRVDLQALTPRVGRAEGNHRRWHQIPGLAAGVMSPVLDLKGLGTEGGFLRSQKKGDLIALTALGGTIAFFQGIKLALS